jgi:hypothetical protein
MMIFVPKVHTHSHSRIQSPCRLFFGFTVYFSVYQRLFFAVSSAFPLERLLSRKLTLRSLKNDFCCFVKTFGTSSIYEKGIFHYDNDEAITRN